MTTITEQPETIKGTILPEYKNIFDLYLKDSTTEPTQLSSKTGDDSTSEFSLGEAAFLYQNGRAWTDLQKAGMKAESVGMIPITSVPRAKRSRVWPPVPRTTGASTPRLPTLTRRPPRTS